MHRYPHTFIWSTMNYMWFLTILRASNKPNNESEAMVQPADLVNSFQKLIKSNKTRTEKLAK